MNWPKPFTGLDKRVPPVVVLTPDPACFSSPRLTGSHCSPKTSGVGRAISPETVPGNRKQGRPPGKSTPTTGGTGSLAEGTTGAWPTTGRPQHILTPVWRRALTDAPARLPHGAHTRLVQGDAHAHRIERTGPLQCLLSSPQATAGNHSAGRSPADRTGRGPARPRRSRICFGRARQE
jgi:hypothetical protein